MIPPQLPAADRCLKEEEGPLDNAAFCLDQARQKHNALSRNANPEEKQRFKQELLDELNYAYQIVIEYSQASDLSIRRQALEQLAQIFYLFGRTEYGKDFDNSRMLFQASIEVFLCRCGAERLDMCDFEYDDLSRFLEALSSNTLSLAEPEEVLGSGGAPLIFNGVDMDHFIDFAVTLMFLGYSYQNLDQYNKGEEENITRFKSVYGTAREVLEKAISQGSERAREEMGDLIYNTGPFMSKLERPDDFEAALAALCEVMQYTDTKDVQIHNIKTISYRDRAQQASDLNEKQQLLERALEEVNQALTLAENDPDFNKYFLADFLNNRVNISIEMGLENYRDLENDIQRALKTATDVGLDPLYSAIYYITAIRLDIARRAKDRHRSIKAMLKR